MIPLLVPIGLGILGGYLSKENNRELFSDGGSVGEEILHFEEMQVKIRYNPKFKRWEGLQRAINPKTREPLQKWGFDRDSKVADSKEELISLYKKYANGGDIDFNKVIFQKEPLLVKSDRKGNLYFDFDSNLRSGWSFDTDDVVEACAIIAKSKFKSDEDLRSIKVNKSQIKNLSDYNVIYWLSGGNRAWKFSEADYKYGYEKTFNDLWSKEGAALKKHLSNSKTLGDIIDVLIEKYFDYPYLYADAIENGYTEDNDEEYENGGITKSALGKIRKQYDKNEDKNFHSENVVLLAKHFGTEEDLEKAKSILKQHNEDGFLSNDLYRERYELRQKLYKKMYPEKYAEGGEIKYFDRHAEMDKSTFNEIFELQRNIEDLNLDYEFNLVNSLYGLFDGYDYSNTYAFKRDMDKLKIDNPELHEKMQNLYKKIQTYKSLNHE